MQPCDRNRFLEGLTKTGGVGSGDDDEKRNERKRSCFTGEIHTHAIAKLTARPGGFQMRSRGLTIATIAA
jgi:hypothetical protein